MNKLDNELLKQNLLCIEMEMFLVRVLNLGYRDENFLKGFYERLVNYEYGRLHGFTGRKYETGIKKLLKYYSKAITVLSKSNPNIMANKESFEQRIEWIDSSSGIRDLYFDLIRMNPME